MHHCESWQDLWTTAELEKHFGIPPSEVERYRLEREQGEQSPQDEAVGQNEIFSLRQPVLHPAEVWSSVEIIKPAHMDGYAVVSLLPSLSLQLLLLVW